MQSGSQHVGMLQDQYFGYPQQFFHGDVMRMGLHGVPDHTNAHSPVMGSEIIKTEVPTPEEISLWQNARTPVTEPPNSSQHQENHASDKLPRYNEEVNERLEKNIMASSAYMTSNDLLRTMSSVPIAPEDVTLFDDFSEYFIEHQSEKSALLGNVRVKQEQFSSDAGYGGSTSSFSDAPGSSHEFYQNRVDTPPFEANYGSDPQMLQYVVPEEFEENGVIYSHMRAATEEEIAAFHLEEDMGSSGIGHENQVMRVPADMFFNQDVPGEPKAKRRRLREPRLGPTHSRFDNSLLVTTQKFMALRDSWDVMNLNEAAAHLNVPKRRLYDITNVLEGIDLVEKVGKNSIRWKADTCDEAQVAKTREADANQKLEEETLDELIANVDAALKIALADPTDLPYSYVPFADLREIGMDQTVVAVKSPHDTYTHMQCSDPVRTNRFELLLKNANGCGMQALLCPDNQDAPNEIDPGMAGATLIANGNGQAVQCHRQTDNRGQPVARGNEAKRGHVRSGANHILEEKFPLDSATSNNCASTIPGTSSVLKKEIIESANDDIVMPPNLMRHQSVSDLIGSASAFLSSPGSAFMSPLKMLFDPNASFASDIQSQSLLLEPPADHHGYPFGDDQLGIGDLFGPDTDWTNINPTPLTPL